MRDRRSFLKATGVVGIGGVVTTFETACPSIGSIETNILKYIPVGLQGFQTIVDILTSAGVINPLEDAAITTVIALVKAGFADLQTAISNYENAPAANKTTLLGKISTALADLQSVIQQFWNDLKIPDQKVATTIQDLLGLILSTLGAFLSQLPAPAGSKVQTKAQSLPNNIQVKAKMRSVPQFKEDFNSILDKNGYSQYKKF